MWPRECITEHVTGHGAACMATPAASAIDNACMHPMPNHVPPCPVVCSAVSALQAYDREVERKALQEVGEEAVGAWLMHAWPGSHTLR